MNIADPNQSWLETHPSNKRQVVCDGEEEMLK